MVRKTFKFSELNNLSSKELNRLMSLAEKYLVQKESWTGQLFWESSYHSCGTYGSYHMVLDNTVRCIIESRRFRILDYIQYSKNNIVSVHFPRQYYQYFSDSEISELEKYEGVNFDEYTGVDVITP